MITCPRCGKSNPDGTEFCLYCGYDLKKKADLAIDRKIALKFYIILQSLGFHD